MPLLTGSVRDEAKIFTVRMPGVRLAPKFLVRYILNESFAEETASGVEELYPYKSYRRPADAMIHALGDAALACKCYDAAEAAAPHTPVYYYRFDYDDHLAPHMFGAGHAIEIPFIFNTLDQPTMNVFFKERHIKKAAPLSEAVMNYWTNFARIGDPNGPGLVEWPIYDIDTRQRIYLDLPQKVAVTDDVERCEFWQEQNLLLK